MTSTIPSREVEAVRTTDLGVLYTRYWDMVVGYLRGQGARDPEDLAGDVFFGVMRNLDRFDGDEGAFRSWLLVIAHRRLVDQRRAHSRRPLDVHEPAQIARLVDRRAAGDAEAEAIANLATTHVLDALDQLTDEQRTVVLLHEVVDLSLPQIAQTLGKGLAAVKSLHHRGLAAAARALGDPSTQLAVDAG